MAVYEDILVSWGLAVLLSAAFFLLKSLFCRSPMPPLGRKKEVTHRFCHADNDFVSISHGPSRLPCRNFSPDQAQEIFYHRSTYAELNASDSRYRHHRDELFQAGEELIPQHRNSYSPEFPGFQPTVGDVQCSRQQFKGFRRNDLIPPGDLLGVALALKTRENAVANASNQIGRDDYAPFLSACWDCDVRRIEAFIELGADILQKTDNGETGLMLSTYMMAKGRKPWNSRCLEVLLENVTKDRNTALHLAVKAGHSRATGWLLTHGASTSIANNKGWRPMAIAQVKGRPDLVQLLWDDFAETLTDEDENGSKDDQTSSYQSAET